MKNSTQSSKKIEIKKEEYITIATEEGHTVMFYMNIEGINSLVNFFDIIINNQEKIKINQDNALTVEPLREFDPINNVFLIFNELASEIILNCIIKEQTLYMYGNKKSFAGIKNELLWLKERLENGHCDDSSFMSSEWGGDSLIAKQLIENSSVVHHLRLYGIEY